MNYSGIIKTSDVRNFAVPISFRITTPTDGTQVTSGMPFNVAMHLYDPAREFSRIDLSLVDSVGS